MVETPARISLGAGAALLLFCAIASGESAPERRSDGASKIPIVLDGSFQNAAWSPSGARIVFTRFRGRYPVAQSRQIEARKRDRRFAGVIAFEPPLSLAL